MIEWYLELWTPDIFKQIIIFDFLVSSILTGYIFCKNDFKETIAFENERILFYNIIFKSNNSFLLSIILISVIAIILILLPLKTLILILRGIYYAFKAGIKNIQLIQKIDTLNEKNKAEIMRKIIKNAIDEVRKEVKDD